MKFTVILEDPTIHEEYFRRAAAAEEENTGFNLILPDDILLQSGEIRYIDMKIRCIPVFEGPYLIRPRPLMERGPLRLLIDREYVEHITIENDYRDTVKLCVKNTDTRPFEIWRGERYFQACHPSLCPVSVEFATAAEDLEPKA